MKICDMNFFDLVKIRRECSQFGGRRPVEKCVEIVTAKYQFDN